MCDFSGRFGPMKQGMRKFSGPRIACGFGAGGYDQAGTAADLFASALLRNTRLQGLFPWAVAANVLRERRQRPLRTTCARRVSPGSMRRQFVDTAACGPGAFWRLFPGPCFLHSSEMEGPLADVKP